ncbi:hypothetical protein ACE6H2_028221 [Prunus campanulata]
MSIFYLVTTDVLLLMLRTQLSSVPLMSRCSNFYHVIVLSVEIWIIKGPRSLERVRE